ncbi:TraB/GumN family protein [Fulvivirga sp. RKSG066]|nr:TraB/GumN family protein [Fulvivirga aurantia]
MSLLLLLSSGFLVNAQSHNENALLWKVTGNGLQQPSYIFGILKFIPTEDYILPNSVIDKMSDCEILSTETLLDHHAKHELNKAAHLDHHQSIDEFLTESEYKKLQDIFHDRLGVSHLKFDLVYKKFKPIMLSTTMTRLAMGDVHFYELDLIQKAHQKDMLILGLETVEREVKALESFKMDDQVSALKHTIENFDQQIADYKTLIEAYKSGDLHKTLEYFMHPVEENEDFRKHFVIQRNKEWLPKMTDYMKKAPTFFAVGTSHLPDDDGLIHLLQEEGYNVEPIKDLK